ncbi:hypothetical protein BJP24_20885 [Aeromonas allosaccharophila]|nr:hypothetical protein BJP24_20885 [Aeromonas allosaccharophila]
MPKLFPHIEPSWTPFIKNMPRKESSFLKVSNAAPGQIGLNTRLKTETSRRLMHFALGIRLKVSKETQSQVRGRLFIAPVNLLSVMMVIACRCLPMLTERR